MRANGADIFHLIFNPPLALFLLLGVLAFLGFRLRGIVLVRLRYGLASLAVLVYLGTTPAISNGLASVLESRYSQPSIIAGRDQIILVLTDGWHRRTPDGYETHIADAGWERIDAAVRLRAQIGGRILIAGAPSPDGQGSAAEAMAAVVRRFGVPEQEIMRETRSHNTYENLLFSKDLVPRSTQRIWLVTSALHMPRAMAVARHLGLPAIAYPCDFHANFGTSWQAWIPSNHGANAMERVLHELVGLLVYRWLDWA